VFSRIPVLLSGTERAERSSLSFLLGATAWVEFCASLADQDAFHRLPCLKLSVVPRRRSPAGFWHGSPQEYAHLSNRQVRTERDETAAAARAAAVRFSTPSCTKMCSRCFSTVRGLTCKMIAISSLVFPCITQYRTSVARGPNPRARNFASSPTGSSTRKKNKQASPPRAFESRRQRRFSPWRMAKGCGGRTDNASL
jgi:hypothetical protein